MSLDTLVADLMIIFELLRGGIYSEEGAKMVLVQVLSAVAFCHLQGIVHRDLKPEVRLVLSHQIKTIYIIYSRQAEITYSFDILRLFLYG